MEEFKKIENLYLVPNLEKEILNKKEYKKPEAWRRGDNEFLVLSPNYNTKRWEIWNTKTGEVFWTGGVSKNYALKKAKVVKDKLEAGETVISRLEIARGK